MSLSRGVGLGSLGLSNSLPNLGGSGTEDGSDPTTRFAPGANSAWDFINNYARFKDVYYGPLANTPGWSFTRASTGYAQTAAGVLVPFASGELRRTDKGVLIEGAGTNVLTYSADWTNAIWDKSNVTVTAAAAAAPDGTTTATKLEATAAAATSIRQTGATIAATAATFSVYAKQGSGATDANLFLVRNHTTATNLGSISFNYSTGVATTTTGSPTTTVTQLANGWWRIQMSFTSGITSGNEIRPYVGFYGNTESAGEYGYFWGAQLEATAYASSYVPTTTGSATRAADSLTVTGVTGLDFPLTVFCEFERGVDTGAAEALMSVDDGSSNNRALLTINTSDLVRYQTVSGGSADGDQTVAGAVSVGAATKAAFRTTANDVRGAKNGTLGTQDAASTAPAAAPTRISLGNNAGSNQCYGYLRRAAIYSRALTDAELQSLTT